jgi:hypothetical protein
LSSAEFTVVRQTLKDVYAPKFNEKLLLLRFTVQNPNKTDTNVFYDAFKLTVVDDKDRNVGFDCYWSRDGQTDELSMQLKPAQKVDVVAAWPVPANAKIPKLIVQRGNEDSAPVVRYDLSGKIKPLSAPFADPTDPTGSTAFEVISGQAGTYYPMGAMDVKFEGVSFGTDKLNNTSPAEGKRFLMATFSIKNGATNREISFDYGRFEIDLTNAKGDTVKFGDYLVKATRDERADGSLKPGAETRFRAYFELPNDLGGKTLTILETSGPSRTYSFDVSSVE